jgi:aspartyl-tRNA(Asn)/glutamyl-tRNA(Gln) amidotransferase subunit A
VPCGFDTNGAPIGLQLVGRPFDEAMLYRIGHAYQGATDFHTRVPQ